MSEDKEAQEDELLALASIYDEEEFHQAESAQGGEIQLCLELPPDFKVVVKGTSVSGVKPLLQMLFIKLSYAPLLSMHTIDLTATGNVTKSSLCVAGEKQTEYIVCFLPPLVLNFELPADYPSTSFPVFTLSSKWMTRAQVRIHVRFNNSLRRRHNKSRPAMVSVK